MTTDINNINPVLLEEDDRIVAYLKGQMTAEEEQKFIKELEENQELKEKAIVTARLVKGLKQVGMRQDSEIIDALLVSSKEDVEKAVKTAEKQRKAKVISLQKTSAWLSIAASLIFVVWLGLEYSDYRSTTGLGNQYGNSAFTAEMISRGADSPSEAETPEFYTNLDINMSRIKRTLKMLFMSCLYAGSFLRWKPITIIQTIRLKLAGTLL